MNLTRKTYEFEVDGEEFIMYFDMNSFVKYQELAGKNINVGLEGLFNAQSEEYVYFLASTVRRKDDPEKKPLGKELLEGNVLAWQLNFGKKVEEIVLDSLPSNEEKSTKKKSAKVSKAKE